MKLDRKSRSLILCYHRLHENKCNLSSASGSVSIETFEKQMSWLRGAGEILDLPRLLDGSDGHKGRLRIAITFDDGYADNIDLGLSIFKSMKIPITWFVSSGFVREREKHPWWDIIDNMEGFELQDVWEKLKEMDMVGSDSKDDGRKLRAKIAKIFKAGSVERREQLDKILNSIYTKSHGSLVDNSFATEEMIRRAASSNWITIGAHTTWHVSAGSMTANELRDDLKTNREDLEDWSGRPVDFFAYPYGALTDFTKESEMVVEELGFKAAVTTRPGYLAYTDGLYSLNRITVQPGWSPGKFKTAVLHPKVLYGAVAVKSEIIQFAHR